MTKDTPPLEGGGDVLEVIYNDVPPMIPTAYACCKKTVIFLNAQLWSAAIYRRFDSKGAGNEFPAGKRQ